MIDIVLVNLLKDLGWQESYSLFPERVCNMAGLFVFIAIFSCKCSDGGFCGEFLVGYCSLDNCSVIVGISCSLLGCWIGFQERK